VKTYNILIESELCSLRCGNVCWIRQNVLGCFTSTKETLEDGSTRTVLKLPSVVAPTAAVLPLVKKRWFT
jgi:hypothetical protein